MNYMKSIKILTVTFSLMLTFITTACAGNKDSKSINSQKEKNDMEVIALTKADFLKKYITTKLIPMSGSLKAVVLQSLIFTPLGVVPVKRWHRYWTV